jgi:hypothetical protein
VKIRYCPSNDCASAVHDVSFNAQTSDAVASSADNDTKAVAIRFGGVSHVVAITTLRLRRHSELVVLNVMRGPDGSICFE